MTTNQPRSVGRRLWWIIRTLFVIFVVVALAAAILGGLGYVGYLGVQEIQRSNDSLSMRIDANAQNLNSLRDLVNSEFAEGNPQQTVQISQLENDLALLTEQLEAIQTAQAGDAAVQTEQINTLEAELATAVAQNNGLIDEMGTVQEALVALQSDLNSSGGRIDALGGDVDRLRLQLSALDETVAELSDVTTAAREAEVGDLQQTLTLLQLWGVLTNARLALIDGDDAAAETAVTQASILAADLTAGEDTPAAAALTRLQTRLDLAAAGFATDLPMVAQDLEAASRELTLLLSGPSTEAEIVEATPTATETAETDEATATAMSTSAATATPLASPTAAPTATPTP